MTDAWDSDEYVACSYQSKWEGFLTNFRQVCSGTLMHDLIVFT